MSTLQISVPVPLREEPIGALRVGNTRVLLELVIHAFEDGATPEAITQRYETLALPDVYAVIAYYLANPEEVAAYLRHRDQRAAEVCQAASITAPDLQVIRRRILSKRQDGEGNDAPLAR